MKVDPNNY